MKNIDLFDTLERVYKDFKEIKGYEIPYVAREKMFNAVLGFTLYWTNFLVTPNKKFDNGDSKAQKEFDLILSKADIKKFTENDINTFRKNILAIIEKKLLVSLTENFALVCKFSMDYDPEYDLYTAINGIDGIWMGTFPVKTSSSIWIGAFTRDEKGEIINLDIIARSSEGYGATIRKINEKGELV